MATLINYTFKVGHTTKKLEDWGIVAAVVETTNRGADQMRLEFAQDITAADVVPPDQECQLSRNGTTVFSGVAVQPPRTADGRQERGSALILGPQYYLQKLTYRQDALFYLDDAGNTTTTLRPRKHGRVILFQKLIMGDPLADPPPEPSLTRISAAQQIADALDFAIHAGAPISINTVMDGTLAPPRVTGMPAAIYPPYDQRDDLWVYNVLDVCLRWCPQVSNRWIYNLATPRLEFTTGGTEDYLDISKLDRFDGAGRFDLLLPSLTVVFVLQQLDGTLVPVSYTSTAPIGSAAANSFGSAFITIALSEDEQVPPSDNLAEILHASFQQVFYDMNLRQIPDEESGDCDWSWKPGDRLRLTGAGGHLANASGVIQTVTRDLQSGRTTIRTGPPSHIGLDDLLTLLKGNALKKPADSKARLNKKGQQQQSGDPFQIVAADGTHLRVYPSTLGGGASTDLGFEDGDPDPGYVLSVSGDGVVYGVITLGATGEITSRALGKATTLPADTNTKFHVEIGTYHTEGSGATAKLDVANSRFGPIDANICRNWSWTSDSGQPKYTVSFAS